eukprot:c26843_g2_i1 orf=308-3400(-)
MHVLPCSFSSSALCSFWAQMLRPNSASMKTAASVYGLHPYRALLLLLLICFCIRALGLSEDGNVLLAMKQQLEDPNDFLRDWNASSASPCNWTGVVCDDSRQVVTGLEFPNFALSGPVPTLMCRLPNLTSVNFYYNNFGGAFPDDLLSCSKVTNLNLSQNLIVGNLPANISKMDSLQVLALSSNNFSGSIPEGFGRLAELVELDLFANLLNGTIPAFFGQLSKLQYFRLAYNPFAPGPIPETLGNLLDLREIWLTSCSLTGTIPKSLGNLTKLTNLDLAMNSLIGDIPPEIMNIGESLVQLELFQNHLSGQIPSNLGDLVNIQNIDMSSNSLTGSIPHSVSQMKVLSSLHLFDNNLSGEIPSTLADLPHLNDLRLFKNNFSGKIPQNLGNVSAFVTFDVSYNRLTGPLPPHLCDGGVLQVLATIQNNLTGSIPESYGSCTNLQRLRMSDNQLTGEVPNKLWSLPHLVILDLVNNRLEGSISSEIGKAFGLSVLKLDNNLFSGSLPTDLGNIWNLSVISITQNNLIGSLPNGISKLSHLSSLYLQGNLLSGEIPSEIVSCGYLSVLNLSRNQFTGQIPTSLGRLQSLNSLDLSHNRLSGEIPESLNNLKLNQFNVSDNSLSGPVPSGLSNGAFSTSFLGNEGLCGQQLLRLKACPNKKESKLLEGVLAGTFGAALLIFVVGLAWFYKRYHGYIKSPKGLFKADKSPWILTSFHKLAFSEYEVLHGLDEDNVIGSGSAGKVYRITLSNGQIVAVKKLWGAGKGEGKYDHDHGFKAEVATLGKIRHMNIVKLLCCCSNNYSRLLVYEYMPNGSLGDVLHGPKAGILDWPSRHKIALGAAQGLAYLHHDCSPAIVHRDVKSNNILLDLQYESHVSDFGLAKILESVKGDSVTASAVAGSVGYIAPEHAYTSKVTAKSDVYSFGVVLLELVTGKRHIFPEFGEDMDLVKWVYRKIQTREGVMEVVDPSLPDFSKEDVLVVLKVALLCTSTLPVQRPTMREVVEMLIEANPTLSCVIGKSASKPSNDPNFIDIYVT